MPFHDDPPQPSPPGEQRVALVIGNGRYAHATSLANPVNDAEAMADVLARLDFDVVTGFDLDLRAIGDVQGEFEGKLLANPQVALFFYAGHGLQVDGRNYLIPIDAEITHRAHLASRALLFNDILDPMASHAGAGLIFLDACRDNPFTRNLLRALDLSIPRKLADPLPTTGPIRGGLARIDKVAGTFIAYATAPDMVAYDGKGANSPFTGALLKHIEVPGISISDMMIDVRNSVLRETHGRQEPWDQSSLRTRFYFAPMIAPPSLRTKMIEAAAEWGAIQHTESLSILLRFRERYLDSPWSDYADMRIAEVRQADKERRKAAQATVAPAEPGSATATPPARVADDDLAEVRQGDAVAPPGAAPTITGGTPTTATQISHADGTDSIDDAPVPAAPSFLGPKAPTDHPVEAPKPPFIAVIREWPFKAASNVVVGFALATLIAAAIASWSWKPRPPATDTLATPALTHVDKRTRFIIALERQTEFEIFSLTAPNRVLIKLPEVKLQLPQRPAMPFGLVKDFRGGLYAPGEVGIIKDVTAPVKVESAAVELAKNNSSASLVLELVAAESLPAPKLAASEPPKPPLPKPAVRATYKPVVVIDPGHGGYDTGAQQGETAEKNLILAFSLEMRDRLNATGRYRVLLTRDTDTYVDPNERREFAERNHAAIFISIHAHDSGKDAKGIAIYSLVDSSQEARAAAKRKVLSDANIDLIKDTLDDPSIIKNVLTDLTLREIEMTPDRTMALVQALNQALSVAKPIPINDPFSAMSFGAPRSTRIPSALLQLGNASDEGQADNLKSNAWREKVEQSVITAFDNYFSHQLARLPM